MCAWPTRFARPRNAKAAASAIGALTPATISVTPLGAVLGTRIAANRIWHTQPCAYVPLAQEITFLVVDVHPSVADLQDKGAIALAPPLLASVHTLASLAGGSARAFGCPSSVDADLSGTT